MNSHVLDVHEIQTVYSCLNRTEIIENRDQNLKANRTISPSFL